VRNPRLMSVPYADQGRVRDDIRRLIAGLGATHERVALLCHDFEDLAFAAEFGDVEVRYTEQPQRFLSWIRGCALSVGYRLHAFVSAVALDRPALHISYDERGASMIATLGLEAFDVPMPATRDVAGTVLELVGSGSPRREAQAVLDTLHDALVAGAEALEARAFAYAAARHTVL